MPEDAATGFAVDPIVPVEHYTSKEFAEKEAKYLWPRVWQMACREEEIPRVGNYVTYDILDDSIIVIRASDTEIRAFHNVCPHRGRTLTQGCGRTAKLHCKFHGWQWDLHGNNTEVVDKEDWRGSLGDCDIALKPVRVGTWAGWVYINMDPDAESLEEFLSPAKAILDPFRMQDFRYHWRKSTILPCNWKTALEAFDEGYHVQTTHRQLLEYIDDVTVSFAQGRHGMFAYWDSLPPGNRSRRLTAEPVRDIRPVLRAFLEELRDTLNSGETAHAARASARLTEEIPYGTNPLEVLMKFGRFVMEEVDRDGAEFPQMTYEELNAGGTDWHFFPNQVFLQSPTGLLGYRARPNGGNVDSCIWEVYSLQRFGPGKEPKDVKQEWSMDHADEEFWGKILCQDYANMGEVQKGMKSRGFTRALTNPKQEVSVANFHRALQEFVDAGTSASA